MTAIFPSTESDPTVAAAVAAEASARTAADTSLDTRVDALEVAPPAHTHDDRYFTEAEVTAALALKQDAATAATDAEVTSAVAAEATARAAADTAHEADTSSVHGIANTAVLAVTNAGQSFTGLQTFTDSVVVGDSSGTHGEARVRFPTNTSGRGPSVVDFGETTFNSEKDPTIYLGYNQGADGNVITSGEPGLSWCIEGNYNDGTADKKMEAYLQYKDGTGANTKRPLFVQFNRTTHFVATTLAGDQIDIGYSDNTTRIARFVRNALTIEAPSTGGDSFLVVKAAVGKAARVQLGYNGVDTVLDWTMVSATQSSILQKDQAAAQQAIIRMYSAKAGATAKCMTVGGVDETAAVLGVYGTRTDQSVLRVRANSTQNNPIIEALDSAGTTTYGGISKGGYFFTRKTSAPADADLVAGEMAIWFDPTNSAAKLMIKAKETGGTVRTGSVALA